SSVRMIQTRYFSFQRSSTPSEYSFGKPALKDCGGSKSTLGNMKRPSAVSAAPAPAAKATHPTVSQFNEARNERRVTPASGGLAVPGGFTAPVGATGAKGVAGGAGVLVGTLSAMKDLPEIASYFTISALEVKR